MRGKCVNNEEDQAGKLGSYSYTISTDMRGL